MGGDSFLNFIACLVPALPYSLRNSHGDCLFCYIPSLLLVISLPEPLLLFWSGGLWGVDILFLLQQSGNNGIGNDWFGNF